MLKFIKHHMSTIDGIETYPIISLSIFVAFFAGLLMWVFLAKKENMDKMSQFPLNH